VFGDRAAQEAVDCVLAAQANQRLQPRDLVDVLEEVGAQALLDVADERGALAKVQDELFAFAQLVDAETSLRSALTDPAIPAERSARWSVTSSRARPMTSPSRSSPISSARIGPGSSRGSSAS